MLFACFTAGLGMLLLLNRLPFFRHPMLRSKSMPLITRDKFALAVEADGRHLDVEAVAAVLRMRGAGAVEVVEPSRRRGARVIRKFLLRVVLGTAMPVWRRGI